VHREAVAELRSSFVRRKDGTQLKHGRVLGTFSHPEIGNLPGFNPSELTKESHWTTFEI
jgi:hypothetical protein